MMHSRPRSIDGSSQGLGVMNDMVRLIQPVIPGLRRYAHALLRDRERPQTLLRDASFYPTTLYSPFERAARV